MTSSAKMATGSMVVYNGSVYAELVDITPPTLSVEKVDATSHDSLAKVSIPGQESFGDLKFKANFLNDTTQAALRALAVAKTVGQWRFVYPASSGLPTYTVNGFVSAYQTTAPLKGSPAQMTVSITPTESVTEVTGAGTTMSALTMTKLEGGTVSPSPTFSASTYVYDYVVPQATVTGFTLTPTSAATTIYVDGTSVTSTQASGTLGMTLANFPTGSVKTVFIVCDVASVKPVIYELRFTRGTA